MNAYKNDNLTGSVLAYLSSLDESEGMIEAAESIARSRSLPLGALYIVSNEKDDIQIIENLKAYEKYLKGKNIKLIVMYGDVNERLSASLRAFQVQAVLMNGEMNSASYEKMDIDYGSSAELIGWPGNIADVDSLESGITDYLTTGNASC